MTDEDIQVDIVEQTIEANITEESFKIDLKDALPDNKKVRVSLTDTTAEFLYNKFSNTGNVDFNIVDVGSNESVKADYTETDPIFINHPSYGLTSQDLINIGNLSGTNTGDVSVLDSSEIDFTLTGQQITASIKSGSIDETKLDTSVNVSLDLADSAIQTELDPVFTAHPAYGLTSQDLIDIGNLSGNNTGDQDLSGLLPNSHLTDFVHSDIAHTNRSSLDLVSGTNTGDQTLPVNSDFNLASLGDVDDTDKAEGKILKVNSEGNHIYVTDESGTDEKVKYDVNDTTAGYLVDKVVAGEGISLAEGTEANENKLEITNDDTGSSAVTSHESTYDHSLIVTALQEETDPVYSASQASNITETDITNLSNLSGTNTGDQDLTPYALKTDYLALDQTTPQSVTGGSPLFNGGITLNATSIVTDTTTGLNIGTSTTQKLGFYNATPVVQQTATTDLGTVLSNLGLRAAGNAYPITTTATPVFKNNILVSKGPIDDFTLATFHLGGTESITSGFQTNSNDYYGILFSAVGNNIYGAYNTFFKSRTTDGHTRKKVLNGDNLGVLEFMGDTETQTSYGATISIDVDGTVNPLRVPTSISFSTTSNTSNLALRLKINSDGSLLTTNKVIFTQTDGNEFIDSLNDGYMDYGATTAHRFNGDVHINNGAETGLLKVFATDGGTSPETDGGISVIQKGAYSTWQGPATIEGFQSDATGNFSTYGSFWIQYYSDKGLGIGNFDETALATYKLGVEGKSLFNDKIAFTQTDGNEYIDSLNDGYMDYGATTAHRFSGPVHAVHKAADGTSAVADGTYTIGIGGTTNGTITIKDGIIIAVQEAVA